jgi:hypothetical protein
VITMKMLGKVRRMYLRDKLSLHEISKRTGIMITPVRNVTRGVCWAPSFPGLCSRVTCRRMSF